MISVTAKVFLQTGNLSLLSNTAGTADNSSVHKHCMHTDAAIVKISLCMQAINFVLVSVSIGQCRPS